MVVSYFTTNPEITMWNNDLVTKLKAFERKLADSEREYVKLLKATDVTSNEKYEKYLEETIAWHRDKVDSLYPLKVNHLYAGSVATPCSPDEREEDIPAEAFGAELSDEDKAEDEDIPEITGDEAPLVVE